MAGMEITAAKAGDRVAVTAGKYKDYSGIVTSISGTRIMVALIVFERMTPPVEVSASDLRVMPAP